MASVLRHGHRLVLYCYEQPSGVPVGVEIADAAAIIPREKIIRYRNGSVALFSNWFRYELQRRGIGTWIDCDVYLVAPLDQTVPFLFGWQDSLINGAVLRLPAESPMVESLLEIFEKSEVPDWLPLRERIVAQWHRIRSGEIDLSKMRWGSAGPLAITTLAKRYGRDHHALARDVFYPVGWQNAGWIRKPTLSLENVITPRTVAVHLWNECIKQFKNMEAPKGSFLARLHDESRSLE
jgi:hypothetical protein